MLENLFKLSEKKTDVKTEIIAGVTTFLAMAYILAVNPGILGAAGMDVHSVFMATAISSGFASILMGVLANYPVALAPGMGVNAFFTYTAVLTMGETWQSAFAAASFVTIAMMILTYSISNGMALGFITYAIAMVATNRSKEVSPVVWCLVAIFILYFGFLA